MVDLIHIFESTIPSVLMPTEPLPIYTLFGLHILALSGKLTLSPLAIDYVRDTEEKKHHAHKK